MKSAFRILFALSILTFGCGQPKANQVKSDAQTAPGMVGNDRDDHGCIGSAGYTWSALKNECVRLFEVGIRLDPKDASLDPTTSVFIVFKSPDNLGKAEVFVPGSIGAQIFEKQPQSSNSEGVWKGGNMVLKLAKGVYTLEDSNKKLLYQGK